jgi:hypothetical protein
MTFDGLLISTLVALALSHLIALGFGWLLACEQFRPPDPSDWSESAWGDVPDVPRSVSEMFHNGTDKP